MPAGATSYLYWTTNTFGLKPTTRLNHTIVYRGNGNGLAGVIATKMLYATQAQVAPPTFVLFVNHPKAVTEAYLRFLQNGFRAAWGFIGTPIRLRLRARREQENPT